MDKRYQIFISSTFRDLKDERQAVLLAIQKLNHIPAGMELFPSADAAPWDVIERIIAVSDYYVLIIGGRYGSMDQNGVSFTEREYDLAVKLGVPVLPFLHADPGAIPARNVEGDGTARERLDAFRAKVQACHYCGSWNSAEDLAKEVVVAVATAISMNPRSGWVRGDFADDVNSVLLSLENVRQENESLRQQVLSFERQRAETDQISDFAQGTDHVELDFIIRAQTKDDQDRVKRVKTTWHDVFLAIAWSAVSGAGRNQISEAVAGLDAEVHWITDETWQRVITQLLALNLVTVRTEMESRSSLLINKGAPTLVPKKFWYLTDRGIRYFAQSQALRREPAAAEP